jgi:hypothetical protein
MTGKGCAARLPVHDIWLNCWLAAYAPDARAHIAWRGQLLLPQHLTRPWPALRILHGPTNLQTPRFEPAFGAPGEHPPLRHLLAQSGSAALWLDYVPQAQLDGLRSDLQGEGLALADIPHAACPVTDCSQGFDGFVARRGKRERQRIRKLLRQADDPGAALRLVITGDPAAVPAALERCLLLEQCGWKGQAGSAVLDDPADAAFYRALAASMAAAGLLRLALLEDDRGELIAFELCILWGNRLVALKTSCSEQHLDLSPGHLLALLHIRQCCADPAISCYDVTGNGLSPAAHLLRYADRTEQLRRVVLFAAGWRGMALRLAWHGRLLLQNLKIYLRKRN